MVDFEKVKNKVYRIFYLSKYYNNNLLKEGKHDGLISCKDALVIVTISLNCHLLSIISQQKLINRLDI